MGKLTHTVSGSVASFLSADKADIESLKAHFLPVQSGIGDPSPSNVRPITGWTGLNVKYFPKNLLEINRSTDQTTTGIVFTPIRNENNKVYKIHVEGANTGTNCFFNLNYVNSTTLSIPPGNYKISGYTNDIGFYVYIYNAENVEVNVCRTLITGESTFTIPQDARCSWMRLQVRGNAQVNEDIYPILLREDDLISEYPVSWSSTGTVYGGYVDLITGEVWRNYLTLVFDGTESYTDTGSWVAIAHPNRETAHETDMVGVCSHYPYGAYTRGMIGVMRNERYAYADGNIYNAQGWKQFVTDQYQNGTPLTLSYLLKTPMLVATLTPLQIKTLTGQNNVWSNANSVTDVTYAFTDRLFQRRFAMNSWQFIPPEYKQYDYVILEGHRARIDTGVSGNDDTLMFRFAFMPLNWISSYAGIMGNYKTENDDYAWRVIALANTSTDFNRSMYVTLGNNSPGGGGTIAISPINSGETLANKKIYVDMTYGQCTMVGTKTVTVTRSNATKTENDKNIAIGSSATTGSTTSFPGHTTRLYSGFEIWSHGIMIRNYVAVVRKSDNIAGLYDTINHTFNRSTGSIDFVAGND